MKAAGLSFLLLTLPLAASETSPFVPWVVTVPSRIPALPMVGASLATSASSASLPTPGSPARPGLLLEVPHLSLGEVSAEAAARSVVASAHAAGWRAGLSVELHDEPEPVAGPAADAATAESLFPGLGSLLAAARGADLFVLSFPELTEDPRPYRWVIRKVAAEIRGANPSSRIAVLFPASPASPHFPAQASSILNEEVAAYVDLLGLRFPGAPPAASELREAADRIALGRPLLVRSGNALTVSSLLALASSLSPTGRPFVAAELAPDEGLAPLASLAGLLAGDFGPDQRAASAAGAAGEPVASFRFVPASGLGGVVLLPGADHRGSVTLTLDAPAYAAATIVELGTGRSRTFPIPKGKEAPRLLTSTATGPVAVVLEAREPSRDEGARAATGVSAVRPLSAEEILARHQAWRAARDARWKRFSAVNTTSIRFRFAELNQVFDLTLRGSFFFETGKVYDWVWSEAYFNGIRWKGKKIPEIPLLQPEKVSEVPLALTFGDAYRYELVGQETVSGVPCYALDFEPRPETPREALYAGRVYIARDDFAVIKMRVKQLNLVGDVQSVDETTDFGLVAAPDGGAPLRFPTRTEGQWILKTFSRTTVMERETNLTDLRIDPAGFEEARKAAFSSTDVMVRDTAEGMRYLEKTKDGGRVVAERKSSQLFGLAGIYYDGSTSYPLPLAGVYYIDLDAGKRKQQVQVFFGGLLLAASFNEPKLFGTNADLGVDVFGIAIRGTDSLYRNGTEDKSQAVKQRTLAANLNLGYPLLRHLKLTGTFGVTSRDYAADSDTSPDFVLPSNHLITRFEGKAVYDVSGWSLTGSYAASHRSKWEPWGLPGNPDWDPSKENFQNWSVSLAKNVYFPSFQRLQVSAAYVATQNADRFSKISFGSFGETGLHGFRGGSLRGERAVLARTSYGLVVSDLFRLEAHYDHALVKDTETELDWANFGGAGVSGQFNGPWSTLVRLDAGVPVVGRNRGQTGGAINLVFLKFF